MLAGGTNIPPVPPQTRIAPITTLDLFEKYKRPNIIRYICFNFITNTCQLTVSLHIQTSCV
jgi:hypothetical protein